MKSYKIVIWAFFYLSASLFGHHAEFSEIERHLKPYADLLDENENEKFLRVFLDPQVFHGGAVFSPERQAEITWAKNQQEEIFPILLEILKREANGTEKNDHFWYGVERKMHLLYWVLKRPDGDPQPFVEEIRRQLPEWSDRQIANHDTHTGFIREALDLLAREGDESDIPLIESFLEDVNGNNKHNAEKSLTKLKDRLAVEPKHSPRNPREKSLRDRENQEGILRTNQKNQGEVADEKKSSSFPWIIAGVLLLGVFVLLFKVFKGKSTS